MNGWKNHETELVVMWLKNEETRYRQIMIIGRGFSISEQKRGNALGAFAKKLKSLHENSCPQGTGVFFDLVSSALSKVDWLQIASALLENEP